VRNVLPIRLDDLLTGLAPPTLHAKTEQTPKFTGFMTNRTAWRLAKPGAAPV
jgi:hypothetical protein